MTGLGPDYHVCMQHSFRKPLLNENLFVTFHSSYSMMIQSTCASHDIRYRTRTRAPAVAPFPEQGFLLNRLDISSPSGYPVWITNACRRVAIEVASVHAVVICVAYRLIDAVCEASLHKTS